MIETKIIQPNISIEQFAQILQNDKEIYWNLNISEIKITYTK